MAGYYDDEEYGPGPHRPGAAQFDTMNLGPGPQRVGQFDTVNLGPAPHRVPQFDTMNLSEPVRVQNPPRAEPEKRAGYGGNATYYTDPAPPMGGGGGGIGTGQTPVNPALETQYPARGGKRLMSTGLVITSLCLRIAAAVSLIIGLAVLASASQYVAITTTLALSVSYSLFSSTKYALAVAIIGAVYSIYETVSAAVRLAMRHPMLPGKISLFISYIGDQVVVVLLLSGASAAAATLKDLHFFPPYLGEAPVYCDFITSWCNQGAGGVAMIFLGFCFVATSLVISSYCFYTGRY